MTRPIQLSPSSTDLSVFATNMTKEKSWVYTSGGAASFGSDPIIPNQPRMYGARLRFSFGS